MKSFLQPLTKILSQSHPLFSGLPVRDFLIYVQFTPENEQDIFILELFGLIDALDPLSKKYRTKSSLTFSTDKDHQIRFQLSDRISELILKFCYRFSKKYSHQKKNQFILSEYHIDDHTKLFFKKLSQYGFSIHWSDAIHCRVDHSLLHPEEIAIADRLYNNEQIHLDFIRRKIYVGDYLTSYKILNRILQTSSDQNSSIYYMLGLCTNYLGYTDLSETYFLKSYNSQDILSKVRASYVLAMLYLRLFPKEKQNLIVATNYLNEGYQLILANPKLDDHRFHHVFNRNGFALCLFRQGKIQEAIDMLQWGISELECSTESSHQLHTSVLTYNLVQCYYHKKDYDKALELSQKLLRLDPLFPEYHLEVTKVHLFFDKMQKANLSLKKAFELDPLKKDTLIMKAFYEVEKKRYQQAIQIYQHIQEIYDDSHYQDEIAYCYQQIQIRNTEKRSKDL